MQSETNIINLEEILLSLIIEDDLGLVETIEQGSDTASLTVENATDERIEIFPTDEVVEIAEISAQGIPGPKGDSTTTVTKIANSNLSGHRAVIITGNNRVDYADKDIQSQADNVLGITHSSAIEGEQIDVHIGGELEELSWNWNINSPIYLSNSGFLTQTLPTTGFVAQVGIPISSTKMLVSIRPASKTPVKGVDYFTQTDIDEILTELVGQIQQDKTYTHYQSFPSNEWHVVHNLNKYPSISLVDSAGSWFEGLDVEYTSLNELVIRFSSEFSGQAYLN